MGEKKMAELWGVVEVMGHSRYAGRISEYAELGVPLVRVEIPETAMHPAHEKLLGAASIFRITPCTEDVARRVAEQCSVSPLSLVGLPSVEPARIGCDDEDSEDEEDEEQFGPEYLEATR
jgi:hypothetical protein